MIPLLVRCLLKRLVLISHISVVANVVLDVDHFRQGLAKGADYTPKASFTLFLWFFFNQMTKLNIENKSTENQSSVFFQACTGRTVIVLATGPDSNVQSIEIIVHNIYMMAGLHIVLKSRKYA